MKIAKGIAELIEGEQFPDRALEWIITAKLQPIKDALENTIPYIECEITGKNYRCVTGADELCKACAARENAKATLAMLSDDE